MKLRTLCSLTITTTLLLDGLGSRALEPNTSCCPSSAHAKQEPSWTEALLNTPVLQRLLLVLLAPQSGVGVGDLDGELCSSLHDHLPVLRGHIVGNLCTVRPVGRQTVFGLAPAAPRAEAKPSGPRHHGSTLELSCQQYSDTAELRGITAWALNCVPPLTVWSGAGAPLQNSSASPVNDSVKGTR